MANEYRLKFYGKHATAFPVTARELDVEGALRSGKTTLCLARELTAYINNPGIHGLLCRWTDKGVYGLVVPIFTAMCEAAGERLTWNSQEEYYEFQSNRSRAYVRGLKSQDQTLRYSKFRGLTLSRVYADQAEEIPQDVYLELTARLSQHGYDHQITISPQSVSEDHWIAKHFPADGTDPERRYCSLSVHDNAHNLHPAVIPSLMKLYPPGHPQHRTLVLGQRGMSVVGDPVYKGAFVRAIHEARAEFDPALPLEMALDFGKHHPCAIFRQRSVLGQVRFLGGILGQQLYLDDFLDLVLRFRAQWFPDAVEILECCDPAGTSDTSHGTHGAIQTLRQKGIHPRWIPDANSPAMRLAAIERMAATMRRRTADRQEAFVVSNADRWLRISEQATVADRFLADGFEAGYVWDEHFVSVGNKPVRKPKKDGWYEHGQNCAEYLELNFGIGAAEPEAVPVPQYRPVSAYL